MDTTTTPESDVVIVGGGIGGLSNAYALACAGRSVTLLEQASQFGEVGAGLQLAPNATRILQQWGLLDEVIARGVLPRRLVFRDAIDGSELTHLDLGADFRARYGAPYVVIHRSDLHHILHAACERVGVDLRTSSHVDRIDRGDHSATAVLEGESLAAGLVLAADGLWSELRRTFSDDNPVCSGYVAYRGAVPVDELPVPVEDLAMEDVVVYFGPGCHLVQYPLRGGEMFNQVAVFRSPAYARGEEDWGGPGELDAAFEQCHPTVRAALATVGRSRHWPMFDRLPIERWIDGRVALTGDAAHPMLQYLAQGACQAIEDAANLASKVAAESTPVDWDSALSQYQTERATRTARVQTSARVWGDTWHCDGLTRTLRNALFRDRAVDDYRYVDWLYGQQTAAETVPEGQPVGRPRFS
jgi:2-polyprenyl-6-methoxyphenol hydroxylase-like FAD-dependent oxidoreductase